jgi:hypothetical protein
MTDSRARKGCCFDSGAKCFDIRLMEINYNAVPSWYEKLRAAAPPPRCKFDARTERIIPHLKAKPSVARSQLKVVAVAVPKFSF